MDKKSPNHNYFQVEDSQKILFLPFACTPETAILFVSLFWLVPFLRHHVFRVTFVCASLCPEKQHINDRRIQK